MNLLYFHLVFRLLWILYVENIPTATLMSSSVREIIHYEANLSLNPGECPGHLVAACNWYKDHRLNAVLWNMKEIWQFLDGSYEWPYYSMDLLALWLKGMEKQKWHFSLKDTCVYTKCPCFFSWKMIGDGFQIGVAKIPLSIYKSKNL